MTRPSLRPLSEQVLLITGASSGIGLVTARMAAARGAYVMLVARNDATLRKIVEGIVAKGGVADHAVADVGDPDQLAAAADRTIARFGRIDSWVNCAGVALYAPLLETPYDEHARLFRTNYFGVVHGATIAVPHLRKQGGALITVASIVAGMGTPIMGAYAASKHAVKGFIDSLRIELNAAAEPIVVTLVNPSGIDTPVGAHAANHLDGEALIPPPAYDPALVAEAILDAATHPRREIVVGGIGRLEMLAAAHFPGVYARVGGLFAPLLSDKARAKTAGDNLDRPGFGGQERSDTNAGRSFSLYGTATRHPLLTLGATALALLGTTALLRRHGR